MADLDPLLAALVAMLPARGSLWPLDKRAAWLQLVSKAFELNYDSGGEPVVLPEFLAAGTVDSASSQLVKTASQIDSAPPAPFVKPPPARPTFYVDLQGFARRGANDERIMPGHINDTLFDLRGEAGDLGAITWSDDSRGVRGLQLEISAG